VQTVSTAFTTAETSNNASLYFGAAVAWAETINGSYTFFTIGTSLIGGPDIIPGSGAAPTFLDKYQYTDESDNIVNYMVTRSLGQYPYGTICANAQISLDNTALRYMPGYDGTIGAYVGLTGRPLKLSMGYVGAESIQLFAGYGTGPQNSLSDRTHTQNAYDGMNYLNLYTSTTTPTQINQTADQIIIALLTEAGFSSSQYVVEPSTQQAIGYFAPYNLLIGDILQQICEAEQGLAFFDENGVFHFWNRTHIANISSPSWTFDYSKTINWQTETTPVINDVMVTANPRVVQALQPIWSLSAPTLVPQKVGSTNGTITIACDFSDDNGALPVTAIDTPIYESSPVSDSYYSTNLNSDGSGPTSSGTISLSGSLNGSTYLATFTNTGSQPVYITDMQIYGTPAKVSYVIDQDYSDSTSILANGKNPANNGVPLQINNDLIQTPSTALSNAIILVTDYKSPNVRVTGEVLEVPQLQIGDMVTMTFDDTGVSTNYTIVGITLQGNPDQLITMNLELEVKTLVHYFTINVSTINGTDQIAPG
jgi:hypothetical protein